MLSVEEDRIANTFDDIDQIRKKPLATVVSDHVNVFLARIFTLHVAGNAVIQDRTDQMILATHEGKIDRLISSLKVAETCLADSKPHFGKCNVWSGLALAIVWLPEEDNTQSS